MKISDDVRRAYRLATRLEFPSGRAESIILARFARDALAEAMKAEWKWEDRSHYIHCVHTDACRRDWDSARWQQEADRMLRGD